jgi:CBS-domain-containing membrane protein
MATKRLAVRLRHTLTGEAGELPVAHSVACPRRDRSVDLDECYACSYFAGREATVEGGGMIRCSGSSPAYVPMGHARAGAASTVRTVMTGEAWCATSDVPAARLLDLLDERGAACVPVVDSRGHPSGVVSRSDLLGMRLQGATADAVSTAIAFTIEEGAPIGQAAALMAVEGVHRLPVVDSDGRVVGVVGALDLVRLLARQEGYCD